MDKESFMKAMVLGRQAIQHAEAHGDDFRTEKVHIMYDTYVHEIFHDYPYSVRTSQGFKEMVMNFMSFMTAEARINKTFYKPDPYVNKLLYGNVYSFQGAKDLRDFNRKYG